MEATSQMPPSGSAAAFGTGTSHLACSLCQFESLHAGNGIQITLRFATQRPAVALDAIGVSLTLQ